MRKGLVGLLVVGLCLAFSSVAMAAEGAAEGGNGLALTIFLSASVLAAGFSMGVGAIGPGSGLGQAASGAASAVGRNPEASGKILLVMLVGMAMAEAVAIYALVVALVILFANPLTSLLVG